MLELLETLMPAVAGATPSMVTRSKSTVLALYSRAAVPCSWALSLNVLSVTEPEAPREICRELAAMVGFGSPWLAPFPDPRERA